MLERGRERPSGGSNIRIRLHPVERSPHLGERVGIIRRGTGELRAVGIGCLDPLTSLAGLPLDGPISDGGRAVLILATRIRATRIGTTPAGGRRVTSNLRRGPLGGPTRFSGRRDIRIERGCAVLVTGSGAHWLNHRCRSGFGLSRRVTLGSYLARIAFTAVAPRVARCWRLNRVRTGWIVRRLRASQLRRHDRRCAVAGSPRCDFRVLAAARISGIVGCSDRNPCALEAGCLAKGLWGRRDRVSSVVRRPVRCGRLGGYIWPTGSCRFGRGRRGLGRDGHLRLR